VQDQVRNLHHGPEFDQRSDVAEAGVDAAVGHEADQMNALGRRERLSQNRVIGELISVHCLVDLREILDYHRSRPEVQMADLRIAHLALGQSDGATASSQGRVRVGRPQVVEHGRLGKGDGVTRSWRGDPPTVQDHERRRRHG
jgi:hypothetical protein